MYAGRVVRTPRHIPNKAGFYFFLNTGNQKMYIGRTRHLRRRISAHLRMLLADNHHSTTMQADWDTFGADVFEYGILDAFEYNEALANASYYKMVERLFINAYQTGDPLYGYNNDASSVSFRRLLGTSTQDFIHEHGDDSYWGQSDD